MVPVGLVVLMIGNPHQDTACLLGAIWSLGRVKETIGISKVNSRRDCCRIVEMLWLRTLLIKLRMNQESQMRLWCDNKSAISINNNRVQHDRTKHIEIDRFFIKEKWQHQICVLFNARINNKRSEYICQNTV